MTDDADGPSVSAHRTRPGRRVFVGESSDAWMATGAFVDLRSDADVGHDLVDDLRERLQADRQGADRDPDAGRDERPRTR